MWHFRACIKLVLPLLADDHGGCVHSEAGKARLGHCELQCMWLWMFKAPLQLDQHAAHSVYDDA